MSRRKRFTRNLGRELRPPLPLRTTSEWVRFEHETEPFGVFSYLNDAHELLSEEGRKDLSSLRQWFNDHLDAPQLKENERFWFCAEAQEYVSHARALAGLLRSVGISIVERRIQRVPGKVRWQDNNQVAVFTYRDTPKLAASDAQCPLPQLSHTMPAALHKMQCGLTRRCSGLASLAAELHSLGRPSTPSGQEDS